MYDRPTFGSLFAGIGGIDLGLERSGWECRFQVEWDAFCQRVLAKHWPDVPRYGDIHDVHGPLAHTDALGLEGERSGGLLDLDWSALGYDVDGRGGAWSCPDCLPTVDLLAGGFPCQPFSVAGRRAGMDDDRWLWPEFARAIRELRPRFVLVENVPGLLVGGGMGAVLGDLAELGYDAEWESIPAAAVGAPHLRYRVWIIGTRRPELGRDVADSDVGRSLNAVRAGRDAIGDGRADELADAECGWRDGGPARAGRRDGTSAEAERLGWGGRGASDEWWSVEPDVGRVAHGVPARLHRVDL